MSMSKWKETGFALPTLLLVTTLLLLIATALGQMGFSSLRVSAQDRDADRALFAAEAGLVAAAEEVTRTSDLVQPFTGTLPNETTYEVLVFRNDSDDPMPTVKGVEIPPGTLYLHAIGTTRHGRKKHAGLLLDADARRFRVGALGNQFVTTTTAFDSFNSDDGDYPTSIMADARLAASNGTSGQIFDLTNTQMDGAIFVGAGGDPSALVTLDAVSTVGSATSLTEPLPTPDIVVPDIPHADVDGDGEPDGGDAGGDGSTYELTGSDLTIGMTGVDIVITTDSPPFNIVIEPDGNYSFTHPNGFGNGDFTTGALMHSTPIDVDVPARFIGTTDGSFQFVGQNSNQIVEFNATAETIYRWAGGATWVSDTLPPWVFGNDAGSDEPPSVTNPETLVDGEYKDVTINAGETIIVSEDRVVIENLVIESGGQLALPAGAESVDIFVTGNLTVSGRDALLNNTRKAPKLNLLYTGDQAVDLNGGASAYFTLYAPDAPVSLTGEPVDPTEFYGALVGSDVSVTDANFHFDQATLGIGKGVTADHFEVLARPRF